jgi:hypothetical protein
VTRDQLLAALLLERYGPTRPEDVGGYARAAPVEQPYDDSELTTRRRQRDLMDALAGVDEYTNITREVS